jgi:hypothetical protein
MNFSVSTEMDVDGLDADESDFKYHSKGLSITTCPAPKGDQNEMRIRFYTR